MKSIQLKFFSLGRCLSSLNWWSWKYWCVIKFVYPCWKFAFCQFYFLKKLSFKMLLLNWCYTLMIRLFFSILFQIKFLFLWSEVLEFFLIICSTSYFIWNCAVVWCCVSCQKCLPRIALEFKLINAPITCPTDYYEVPISCVLLLFK